MMMRTMSLRHKQHNLEGPLRCLLEQLLLKDQMILKYHLSHLNRMFLNFQMFGYNIHHYLQLHFQPGYQLFFQYNLVNMGQVIMVPTFLQLKGILYCHFLDEVIM